VHPHDVFTDLIVTGAVPLKASVEEEPYWPEFVELVERARTRTISTIWSCLAAHAAARHLDGIERVRLPRKLSGVYEVIVRADDILDRAQGERYFVPHSRYNEVQEGDLIKSGYRVLASSPEVGVDMFEKATPSRFVFLQGHPEYAPDALFREYRRDIGKFASGESAEIPSVPEGYFSSAFHDRLKQFELKNDHQAGAVTALLDPKSDWGLQRDWSADAGGLMKNWVASIVGQKSRRHQSAEGAA